MEVYCLSDVVLVLYKLSKREEMQNLKIYLYKRKIQKFLQMQSREYIYNGFGDVSDHFGKRKIVKADQ